jgi:hypothetical protein
MQKLCGSPQAGGAAGWSAAQRPSGARNAGQPNKWNRRSANRKRWAAIQPMCCNMRKALGDEVRSYRRACQCRQSRAYALGLLLQTSDPELTALVWHARQRGHDSSPAQSTAEQQSGDQKHRHHRDPEAEIGQRELRQQGNRAFTAMAQIAPHADRTVKLHINQRALIKAVRG